MGWCTTHLALWRKELKECVGHPFILQYHIPLSCTGELYALG